MDEEFEMAAKLKKEVMALKDQALNAEKLRQDYIDREPTLRMSQLLNLLNEIDPSFTK